MLSQNMHSHLSRLVPFRVDTEQTTSRFGSRPSSGADDEGEVLLYSPVQWPHRPKKQRRSEQGSSELVTREVNYVRDDHLQVT
jgi:hypothetical protein